MKFFALLFCLAAHAYQYELSIGAIFQDEEPYLKEWIEFHKLVGVKHFYLYNNLSTDNYLDILQPYIDSGEVELIDWPIQAHSWDNWIHGVQPAAYTDCIARSTQVTKWLALIDIDEFLTPINCDWVPDILKEFEPYGGVGFNWKTFGHSWLFDAPPDKLMIETLIMTAPPSRATNLGVKSIVRPERVEKSQHPHYVVYKPGYSHVNSDKTTRIDVHGSSDKLYYDKLIVNHYWSRTGSYLCKKLKRYKIWFPEIDPENWTAYVEGMNEVPDRTMERFIEPLREKMGLPPHKKEKFDW